MSLDSAASKQQLKKPKPGDARLPSKPSRALPSCSAAASRLLFDMSPLELIDVIAAVLEQAVEVNKAILGGHKQHGLEITRFHTRDPPAISIKAYLTRLLQLGPFPLDALLLATVYINRLTHRQLAQAFKPYKFRTLFPQCLSPDPSPSQEGDHLATSSSKLSEVSPPLTPWTAHRVLLGALAIAAKYTSDAYIGQRRLAKVGGISIKELLELEFEMFKLLSWSCYTSVRELDSVCSQLWRASDRGKHSGDSVEEAQNPPYELDPLQMERLSLSPQVRQRQAISPTPAMSDGGSESSGFASSLDDISPAQISHVGRKEHNSQMWTSIAPALIPLPQ